jgi:hypothetical protein
MVLIVMLIEGQFLLAIGGVSGVIEGEPNGSRGLCVTGEESVHAGLCKSIEVFPVYMVFATRHGRGTG